jgi:hypothetical protein
MSIENINNIDRNRDFMWKEFEYELNDDLSKLSLSALKDNIIQSHEKNTSKPWEFLNWHESKDKKYMVYEYTIKSWWTPNAVRAQAVAKWIAKKKEWIQITNGKAIEYPENEKFLAWTKVYVRILKSNFVSTNGNTNKPNQSNESSETTNVMPKWLKLEGTTYVYEVQDWDSESKIKIKLQKYAPLSYVKNESNGISWFNFTSIPDKKLLPWLKLVVPKKRSERIKTISDFRKMQESALSSMESDSTYWTKIKELIKKYSKNHIANVMTAYAKSETCWIGEDGNVNGNVWDFALFRYETDHQCASYWYHHVLFKWIWKKAFDALKMSIWQCCDPKNSWKLFLAYCIECAEWAQKKENQDFTKFFDMNNTKWCARFYNGSEAYSEKLKKNYEKVKNTK